MKNMKKIIKKLMQSPTLTFSLKVKIMLNILLVNIIHYLKIIYVIIKYIICYILIKIIKIIKIQLGNLKNKIKSFSLIDIIKELLYITIVFIYVIPLLYYIVIYLLDVISLIDEDSIIVMIISLLKMDMYCLEYL